MNKLNQIAAVFLLSLLLVKILIVPAIFVNYELRKDFIIENYCVNKERPELKCDGKCYLAKQIKAAEQKDDAQGTDTFLSKVFEIETLVCVNHFSFEPRASLIKNHIYYPAETSATRSYHIAIYHPPKA